MKKFIVIFLMVTGFWYCRSQKTMGPVGKIILKSAFPCDDVKPNSDDTKLDFSLKSINDKGTKAASGFLFTKTVLDDSVALKLQVFKWGVGWTPFYNYNGQLCKDLAKYIGKIYTKLANTAEPHLPVPPHMCPIKPGNYSLKNFQAESKDVDIPAICYGRILIKATITDKNKKILTCISVEGDSQAPA